MVDTVLVNQDNTISGAGQLGAGQMTLVNAAAIVAELIQPVRGMNDVLPEKSPLWDRVESTAAALFAGYGYQRVRLPVLERTELFSRSIGEPVIRPPARRG